MIKPPGKSGSDIPPPLWLRIQAFLELKSTNTQNTYVGIIREWCEFLGATAGTSAAAQRILTANDLHAIAYRKWLEGQPGQRPRFQANLTSTKAVSTQKNTRVKRDGLQSSLSNSTIAKKFAALRRVYRMLIASNLGISQNPFDVDKVPSPSAKSGQKRPTEMIPYEKVAQILNAPDLTTPRGIRDRALLCLLFGGGLRRSEVVGIRLGDVKVTAQGTMFLNLRATKARKDAQQALPTWAQPSLDRLIQERSSQGAGKGDYLFVSFKGPGALHCSNQPLTANGLYRIFLGYCRNAEVLEVATPHSARATAITKLLSDGLSHREVQEFSRHASVQMVEVYDKRRIGIDENPAKELKYD